MAMAIPLIAVALLTSWLLRRSMTVPLQRVIGFANTMAAGDLSARFDGASRGEFGELAKALKPEQQVKFTFQQQGKDFVIIAVERVKP